MPTEATRNHAARFRTFDRIFWLMWAAFPLMVWIIYATVIDAAALKDALPADRQNCADLMPNPSKMSAGGQAIFWSLFAFQLSIYVVLLATLHVIIHRFAMGRIFVSETLTSLSTIGGILIAWPFLESVVSNGAVYLLHQRGDLPIFVPNYVLDVAPIAVGVFLIALRYMLEHAIAMKSEHDLTI